MQKRHAYLIICHNNFHILRKLVSLLDDSRNDIYIHVDRKVKHFVQLSKELSTHKAHLFFTKRINVNWGGYSQVRAELLLLESALKQEYAYYHLISGVDMPLKSQNEIHAFFDENQGKEFIGIDEQSNGGKAFEERVGYYRLFQDVIGRNTGLHIAAIEKLDRLCLAMQKALHINRTIGYDKVMYKGPNWFSITRQMAVFVMENRTKISRMFQFGMCVDELFLQTIAMESPYAVNIVNDTLRYIDWNRGSPYTFRSDDFDELMNSGKLFARKFDENTDMAIVDRIYTELSKNDRRNELR